MKDDAIKGCVLAICATCAYCTYVFITHANGLVFGTYMGFLGLVGGFVLRDAMKRI